MLLASMDKNNMDAVAFNEAVEKKEVGYTTNIRGFHIRSAFQPVISIPHRRVVGYEGLVRARDRNGRAVSPIELFKSSRNSIETLALDRACRCLHIHNFSQLDTEDEWLFINLDSQCLATEKPHPGFMDNLFSLSGIKPNRVVIEILENEISDREYLQSLIHHFRSMGCLIAIDDFGAGHSNFDRIWELEPDIVKLDRSLVKQAAENSKLKRILKGIVSLIHGTGSLVIIEGVESHKEALVSVELNADMVQGFYFSKPGKGTVSSIDLEGLINDLVIEHKKFTKRQMIEVDRHFSKFRKLFDQATTQFMNKVQFEKCTELLTQDSRVVRCFLLDKEGMQIGKTVDSPIYKEKLTDRFSPLLSGARANWSQKHYHYLAIRHKGELQITHPYLSVAGAHLCITVSIALKVGRRLQVFCCDLDWRDD